MPETPWFDIVEDWHLIVSSFAKQYGIRLGENLDMPFSEFQQLLAGLMPDTPLGNIISIRSEENKETLKRFTKSMLEERRKFRNKLANDKLNDVDSLEKQFQSYEKMFEKLYG